jgi:hypothetical protein
MKQRKLLVVLTDNRSYEFKIDSYEDVVESILNEEWVPLQVENDKNLTWINTKQIIYFKDLGIWQH